MNKLTNYDKKQTIFYTIGQVKGAIKSGNEKRALALLEKVAEDASNMDIELMHAQCERDESYKDALDITRELMRRINV